MVIYKSQYINELRDRSTKPILQYWNIKEVNAFLCPHLSELRRIQNTDILIWVSWLLTVWFNFYWTNKHCGLRFSGIRTASQLIFDITVMQGASHFRYKLSALRLLLNHQRTSNIWVAGKCLKILPTIFSAKDFLL